MGQHVSKNPFSFLDGGGSTLSKTSIGALKAAVSGSYNDEHSSKSTVSSSQESSSQPRQPSPEEAAASARAFFGASRVGKGEQLISRQSSSSESETDERPELPCPQQPSLDVATNRPASKPVKCPTAPRRGEPSHAADHWGQWHEDDSDDVQHLTRLYEQRTWQMFLLITEARKQQQRFNKGQRFDNAGDHRTGEPLPFPDESQHPQPAYTDGMVLSPNHEMIFSCDLE